MLQFKQNIIFDIDNTHPVEINTYEVNDASQPHLPGHPSTSVIKHWIGGFGYDTTGVSKYLIADPAGQSPYVSFGMNTPKQSWVNGTSLAIMAGERGLIW